MIVCAHCESEKVTHIIGGVYTCKTCSLKSYKHRYIAQGMVALVLVVLIALTYI